MCTGNIPNKHVVAPQSTKLCLMSPFVTSGPPQYNKSGSFDHNIWALAVTTLTTKVSTRYIHSPLKWIRHFSPPALEINEQQIIYGKYALCWITVAGDCGGFIREPDHTNHAPPAVAKWQMSHSETCSRLCAVACVGKCSIHSEFNFISSGLNNSNKNLRPKIYHNGPGFLSCGPLHRPERRLIFLCWPT